MRSLIEAVGIALAFTGILPAGSERPARDPERTALELTRRTFEALSNLDVAELDAILADDYRYTGWGGRMIAKRERLRVIESLRDSQDAEAFRLSELDARREGDNVVIVTGRAHQTGRFRGQPFDNEYRFTTVYGLREGEWNAIAHQTTRIAPDD